MGILHAKHLDTVQILHNYSRMPEGLQPAASVVAKCGGIEATARIVKRHRSVVNRWLLPRESGGTGGQVPMHHARILLRDVAELSESDFFAGADPTPAEPSEAAD